MKNRIYLIVGEKILYQDKEALITKLLTIDTVRIEEIGTGNLHDVAVNMLKPVVTEKQELRDIITLSDSQWAEAQRRLSILKPILEERGKSDIVSQIAKKNAVGVTTLYRWLKLYDTYGTSVSLLGKEKNGGRGASRLSEEQDAVIKEIIDSTFLNSSRYSIKKTIRDIQIKCHDLNITSPHPNTVRNRIKSISDEEKVRKRIGQKEAMQGFDPHRGKFPGADFPYSVVQIDHTRCDIRLVDEETRKPFRRPWITVAIDVYSRMVIGFYIAYETPGSLGTGLCIANSILPKENYLNSLNIDASWPCWGFMNTIHLDNAKEFRGKMVKRACENYDINLEFRPLAKPNYGGHIERLLGNFSTEIHNLPGTTFSNIMERKGYDSDAKASMTLGEFEKWMATYITTVYHQQWHSSIGMSPLEKFKQGIYGTADSPGVGSQTRYVDEKKLRLDFMPYQERTIQEYGVLIDHIYYYSDILRNYVHAKTGRQKKKFLFRRDPRDISGIHFYEPEQKTYYRIPYRDLSLPPISIWEHRHRVKKLKASRHEIDQESIFSGFRQMDALAANSIKETKKMKRKNPLHLRQPLKEIQPIDELESNTINEADLPAVKPFEELDDEPLNP